MDECVRCGRKRSAKYLLNVVAYGHRYSVCAARTTCDQVRRRRRRG